MRSLSAQLHTWDEIGAGNAKLVNAATEMVVQFNPHTDGRDDGEDRTNEEVAEGTFLRV